MKRGPKLPDPQMNLRLLGPPAAIIPGGKQEELTQALMELLIHAATEHAKTETEGGSSESETHA